MHAKANYLTAGSITSIMAGENLDPESQLMRMAIVSCFGIDAPDMLKQRVLVLSSAVEKVNADMTHETSIPHGFLGALLNKTLAELL